MSLLHPPHPRRAETRPIPGFVLSRISRCGVAQRVCLTRVAPCRRARERRVSACRGWVGEKEVI